MKSIYTVLTFLFVIFLPVTVSADELALKQLKQFAEGEHRDAGNIARNKYRHPAETLNWFGIRSDMTVVEVSPGGGGWYTEVLAPFLREKGRLYAGSYDTQSRSEYFRNNARKFLDKLAASPDIYDKVTVTEFEPPAKPTLEPAGQADMVLTFRNTHNWIRNDSAEQVFAAMYKVLKKGGVLGLVQHRGTAEMTGKEWASKGYVSEADAIRLAEGAGFRLAGRSEINANPQDSKDHPEGVWTLPPAYRLKDQDREKYAAIGESDRMTLKFIKPE